MALGIHGKSKFSISYFLFHLREIETIDSIFKYILCLEHESTYLWSGPTSALLKIVPKLITCVSNEDNVSGVSWADVRLPCFGGSDFCSQDRI